MNQQIENEPRSGQQHPLCRLSREDLDLTAELLLKSGSLKDLAATYGVSYPTIRNRVDRVIERFKAIIENRPADPLTDLLASLVERGEMSAATARLVRDAARELARTSRAGTVESADEAEAVEPSSRAGVAPAPVKRFDWKPRVT